MPYQILKKGKEYILKSPTRQYKHKTLAKAKAQKRLLEEKEGKVVQSQKVSQKVTVIVNAPKRRAGQARKQTVPQAQTIIAMRPVVPSNPMEAYYGTARPQPRSLLSGDEERIKSIEENIQKLREPFMEQMKQNHLERMSALGKRDSELLPKVEDEEEEEEQPQREIIGVRRGIPRRLSIDSEFQGATIGQLIQGDYGITDSGRQRTEPTKRQQNAIQRWKRQNP